MRYRAVGPQECLVQQRDLDIHDHRRWRGHLECGDAFHYAYTTLSGDGTISGASPASERCGMDESGGDDPRNARSGIGACVHARLGRQRARVSTTGALAHERQHRGLTATARWVGSTAPAPASSISVARRANWTLVGTTQSRWPQVFVGLAVSSHTAAATATATFDQVVVTPQPRPARSRCNRSQRLLGPELGSPTAPPGTSTSRGACTWTARSDVDWLEVKHPSTGLYVHMTTYRSRRTTR